MYNHLANMPPPGVGAPSGQSGPQYPSKIKINKYILMI